MSDNPLQFWLSIDNERERLRLPVNPDTIRVSSSHGYNDYEVANIGDFTVIGDRKQMEFSFSSFFPRDYNPSYCEYEGFPIPSTFVTKLIHWRRERKPIRLIITGTWINYAVTIREFNMDVERGGSPGDIYYELTLREYTFINVKKVDTSKPDKAVVGSAPSRPNTKTPPKSYTVKSGDTLWKIAQKNLGSGDKWRTIYDKNKSVIGKNPNSLKVGQILVMP